MAARRRPEWVDGLPAEHRAAHDALIGGNLPAAFTAAREVADDEGAPAELRAEARALAPQADRYAALRDEAQRAYKGHPDTPAYVRELAPPFVKAHAALALADAGRSVRLARRLALRAETPDELRVECLQRHTASLNAGGVAGTGGAKGNVHIHILTPAVSQVEVL